MPSSVILAALVVAWLVVLLPMVAKHRQQVRRVGGPAMTTRVLHRGDRAVPVARRGPAAGHRSDPDWQEDPVSDERTRDAEAELDDGYDTDTDTDGYETDEHEHGSDERRRDPLEVPQRRRGRGGFDPEADAVTRHARYAVRQRVVLGLLAGVVLTAVVAAAVVPAAWWLNVALDVALVGYLVYLRTQVRIEQEVRERRLHRIDRARLGVASAQAERADELPPRLRRPGAVVVEIDDEDPAFHDLDEYSPHAEADLPRASGQ